MITKHGGLARRALGEHADARELEALFAELRFEDPAKAAALWQRLVPRGGTDPPPPGNIENLLAELASSPDPDMALLNLARFVEARIAPARFLHSFFLARPVARLIVTVFSCSYFLADILIRNPGYLSWLVEECTLGAMKAHSAYLFELSRQIEPFRDLRRRINSAKRYVRRETLRIGARDLLGLAPLEEVTAELSFLADAVIETVAGMAFEELAAEAGLGETAWSLEAAVPFHRFAVISLGKLGGTELNYSSDIDLLYVSDPAAGERESEFYDALARRITEHLSAPTEEGALYRVDLRLRPDGDSGPLVVTLADHASYLQRRAKPWEKQSLIKARVSAGNRVVGGAFIDNCARAVYGAAASFDPLEEIVTMRERWTGYLSDEERAGNIKLMSGGIRDIEFIAQGIQLVHGRSRPEIRSRNTLESLERLWRHGLLSAEAKRPLERSYRLFRTVEHRMQIMRNVRTHTLPSAEADLAKMGERVCRSALRGVTPENFTAELGRSLLEVQNIFNGYFKDRSPGEIPLLLALPANDRAVEEILSKYGLHEGEQAHRFLSSLVFGDFPKLEGIDTLAAAAKSLPLILERISRTPAPELTLRNFVRIVKASGAVRSTLELLGGSGDLLRLLLAVTSLSSRLSDILANRIELLDFLAEGAPPGESPDPKAVDALMRLARRQEEALLIVHSRNPIPEAGPETLGPLLTEVSERALAALFDRHLREERGIAVLAAGSLATRCAHFGSDLDIIAVTTDERSASRKDDVIHAILDDARAMRLGPVDMRLRGEGESAWDVKHVPGGLYDIDFLLSATRLLGLIEHAAPAGRGEEIERLREAGLLEAEDAATLAAAYRVFWTIEHAAALHGIPYPPLPEREDFFESYFDRLFGAFVPGDGTFLKRLGGIRENVRRIFEHFIERAE